MTNNVVGFLLDKVTSNVVLIEKKRPEWQCGKLNGVGGHIESGEMPLEAMQMEFLEETGLRVMDWQLCVNMVGKDWRVHFYSAHGSIARVTTITDEEVVIVPIHNLPDNIIPNLRWLIPLCLDTDIRKPIHIGDEAANEAAHIHKP